MIPIRIRAGGDASTSSMTRYRTFCCYGNTRTGKTRFAATFPNTLFIADASERGWTTMENMDPGDFYHHDHAPIVLPVSNQTEMNEALLVAEEWVRAGYFDTVAIDSLTFYAESWFQDQLRKMIAAGGKLDTRALYGAMANHLSDTRVQVHKWPCHVIWLALASVPDETNEGGPMLSGKSRYRFAAGCDHIFLHRTYEHEFDNDDGSKYKASVYQVHTKSYERYLLGGRDNGKLPAVIPWPTFRTVAEPLGLGEFEQKPDLPQSAIDTVIARFTDKSVKAPAAAPAAAKAAAPPTRARAR